MSGVGLGAGEGVDTSKRLTPCQKSHHPGFMSNTLNKKMVFPLADCDPTPSLWRSDKSV